MREDGAIVTFNNSSFGLSLALKILVSSVYMPRDMPREYGKLTVCVCVCVFQL